MDIVRLAISKPVGVTVAVILVVMFGLIGLGAIPIQLTPTVDYPIITIDTGWTGRSPQEMVDEITKEQEERLKNVTNLKKMSSTSSEGTSNITLEFTVGADINRAMQEVSDALRQVPEYPDDVTEPVIRASEGEISNAVAWLILDIDPDRVDDHPNFDVSSLYDAIDKEVKPYLERIDGVAQVNIYGGREREAQVLLDPYKLAQRGLNHVNVVQALQGENRNVSAGSIAEGKRDYRIRLVGQYDTPDQILETVVAYREGKPVYVKDIGTVDIGYQKKRGFVRSFGHPSLAMPVIRQSGANVVDIMDELKVRLDEIRTEILPNLGGVDEGGPVGPDLRLRQVYDETVYIDSAIGLVTQNLYIGGVIAIIVLVLFLRSFTSTFVIALAIPISVIGTFLVLLALGRTLNVISLAGLAFAVGMVVDNAIVVLENIYRRLHDGESPKSAAYLGGREVWGAVLASTLTTAAVFIPVLTIQEEAGQLFRDISLAIVASVMLSLLVSITVIPAACSRWLRIPRESRNPVLRAWHSLFGLAPALTWLNKRIGDMMLWFMSGWRGWTLRPAIVVLMTVASLWGAAILMPPLDYLPAGNRNLVFGGLLIPPGLSLDQRTQIAETIEGQVKPYLGVDPNDEAAMAKLAPIPRPTYDPSAPKLEPFKPVPVENFFIGAFGTNMFVGGTSAEEQVVRPVGQLLTNAMGSIPDSYGGAGQASLFGRGIGAAGSIDVEISGPDLERVNAAAGFVLSKAGPHFGYADARPNPANFNLLEQEFQVRLNDRGRELGLNAEGLGVAVRGLFDGAFVGDYKIGSDTIDLVVLPAGGRLDFKEQLADIPVATPAGPIVPIDSIVDFVPSRAAQEIRRVEELPTVSVQIDPPDDAALEDVMNWIQTNAIQPARDAGLIDRTMRVRLEGTAAKLDEVRAALFGPKPDKPESASVVSVIDVITGLFVAAGLAVAGVAFVRARKRPGASGGYAAAGVLLTAVVLGAVFFLFASNPALLTARFIWALLVTYLLMAALFESFLYPFVIMFTVPLAIVGGFGGLAIVHWWSLQDPTKAPQQLDVLTMLGFVILIGVVVNNAILLVHQALNFMHGRFEEEGREGPMEPHQAVAESVQSRIRPIFMSVLTSVGGMLPLVLFPGAGSEMYRGLGSVVVGGLLVSTIFTLLLAPLMFSLVIDMQGALRNAFSSASGSGEHPGGSAARRGSSREQESSPELQPA
ncbi:MAG: efflux RND transporter permease subunit [Phycisphaerales bacterium]